MGFAESRWYSGPVYSASLLSLLTVALTLLIVAASLHNLYSFDASSIPDDFTAANNLTLSGSVHLGAFYSCMDIDGLVGVEAPYSFSIHQCFQLPTDCRARFTVQTQDGDVDVDDELQGFTCPQYNAFRSFLVMAIVWLGVGLLLALLSLRVWPSDRALMWAAVGLHVAAIVSVLIAFGLVTDHIQRVNNDVVHFHIGPAFALATTAWVLMVVGLVMFGVVKRLEREGYSRDGAGEGKRLPA